MKPRLYISPFSTFGIRPQGFLPADISAARKRMLAEYELAGHDQRVMFAATPLYRFEAIALFDELDTQRWLQAHAYIAQHKTLHDFLTQGSVPDSFDVPELQQDPRMLDFVAPYFILQFETLSGKAWMNRDAGMLRRLCRLPLLVPPRMQERCFRTVLDDVEQHSTGMLSSWDTLRWRAHYYSDKQCDTLCNEAYIECLLALPESMRALVHRYLHALLRFCAYLVREQNEYKKTGALLALAARLPMDEKLRAAYEEQCKQTEKMVFRAVSSLPQAKYQRPVVSWQAMFWKLLLAAGFIGFVLSFLLRGRIHPGN